MDQDFFAGRKEVTDKNSIWRHGVGELTAGVAAAMQELDPLSVRPSVEHQVEVEHTILKREDDGGSDGQALTTK